MWMGRAGDGLGWAGCDSGDGVPLNSVMRTQRTSLPKHMMDFSNMKNTGIYDGSFLWTALVQPFLSNSEWGLHTLPSTRPLHVTVSLEDGPSQGTSAQCLCVQPY